jgi:hypothetical protein
MTSSKTIWWVIGLGLVAIIIWLAVYYFKMAGGGAVLGPAAPATPEDATAARARVLQSLETSSTAPVTSAQRQAVLKTLESSSASAKLSEAEQAKRRAEVLKSLQN